MKTAPQAIEEPMNVNALRAPGAVRRRPSVRRSTAAGPLLACWRGIGSDVRTSMPWMKTRGPQAAASSSGIVHLFPKAGYVYLEHLVLSYAAITAMPFQMSAVIAINFYFTQDLIR